MWCGKDLEEDQVEFCSIQCIVEILEEEEEFQMVEDLHQNVDDDPFEDDMGSSSINEE